MSWKAKSLLCASEQALLYARFGSLASTILGASCLDPDAPAATWAPFISWGAQPRAGIFAYGGAKNHE